MPVGVSRISISVPPDLLRKFDEAKKRLGYEDRSKALQTAMQTFVTDAKWQCAKMGKGIGAIVMVYDSTAKQAESITETQHRYRSIAESSIHIHLDERNCLQIIPVHGETADVKALAETLMTTDGVKEVKLAIVTP
jgi:CopG family nickel-responsive transcriptional regulator